MSKSSPAGTRRAGDLSPEQLSQLVMRRKQRHDAQGGQGAARDAERIPRRDAVSAPLSFGQQRLWLLDQLEPRSAAYNMPTASRLAGFLDPALLARCLTEIARRHESLRTTFAMRGGEPVQVIAAAAPFPLPVVDLAVLPQAAQGAEVRRLLAGDAGAPFDLAHGPLARAGLLRLGAAEHLLLFNMHHVISDGWSLGLLFGELSTLYEAFAAGRPSPIPALSIQYADFAAWQRRWLQGITLQEQVAYWRQQLAGAASVLALPADRPRTPQPSHRGQRAQLTIPGDLAAALHELSRGRGATLFMTLLAAWKVLLHRWAGQDDIVVGSPSAGRQRVETEQLIGFFLNTLVLRTDLGGNPRFIDLLERQREVVLGAYRFQDLPFERLLEELQVERQLNRSPLFQVLFNMITLAEIRLDLRGLRCEPLELGEPLAKFDFTLYVEEHGSAGLRCNLVYSTDLFDRARMEALLAELRHLLIQIAAAPLTPIAALSLVPLEAAALLPDPSRPLSGQPWPGPIHHRLSEHAARSPQRPMAADDRDAWTYGEMEARANQLAHRLRQAGVGREDVVAIYAHRGASLVWAMLATLKAGAAFLILDPAYPPARLAAYLEIARPAAWLALRAAGEVPPRVEEALAALAPRLRLALPGRAEAAAVGFLAGQPATPPDAPAAACDLACVGFTSGSTGTPKAVLGRHGSLSQFQPWWAERFALDGNDCFAMVSALSHDPLQRDVLTPIWLGARLVVPDSERMGEPGWLAAWAAEQAVTVVHLTPARLEVLVGSATAPCMPALRRAFVIGDLLRRSEVARLQRIAPAVLCVNLFGSTESQRAISYSLVESTATAAAAGSEALPLGRGIEGVDLLVLGAAGGLAGIGELGEVCIRSRHLARGYLGDSELTAQRFVPNPFRPAHADAEDRLYRTGDLGRYHPSGEVEHAGRADQQVKIRGFRIEPGEVEAALRRHPAVRECVVVARGGAEVRLAAYLVPAGRPAAARDLRVFLGETLPEYMVPADLVWLDALPMTYTGKLDRRALPEPQREEPAAAAAARTPVEELLAGIWQELLGGARPIGIHDNFFDLGGHSLLATRVLSRLRAALGVEVPMRALFAAPTLAGLAAAVEARHADAHVAVPPLVPVPRVVGEGGGAGAFRGGALPLSFSQQRLWVLDQLEPGSFAHNLATALRLHGSLTVAALDRAIAEIVRRHEALRTVFPSSDGVARQEIQAAAGRLVAVVDLAALPGARREAEAGRLAAADALWHFDLARGPLLRVTLLRLAERDHDLLLCMHHIVTDGWSLGIFTRELNDLYAAFLAGLPSPLRELPIQYADFAAWQRGWLQGAAVTGQLAYWRRALAGSPPRLELPSDRPRPAVPSHRGGRCWLNLPREAAASLAAASRHLDLTPFMFLLASFGALLARYAGEDDIMVGTPIANRGRRELEDLIGFFANTLALRVDAAGDPPFAELARRVRQMALGAYAHQDLPFERLVDELQVERDLALTPIFQVMFILQNAPPANLALADLAFSPREVAEGKAPFDLTLSLVQVEAALVAKLEYSRDLFDAATGERLMGHFANLVGAAVMRPETRLGTLPLLAAEERRQLLAAAGDPPVDLPAELTVHELFAAAARRVPAAVAVSCGGRLLLYGDLDARADRLARRLARHGVGPEVRVALCLERTPEMVVALLAVLKAGGAYVPLDPSHPAERLGWILEDSGAAILVADRASLAALPRHPAVVIDPAAVEAGETSPHDGPPVRHSGPQNLAYVIYTSGSTGRPKGVEVVHRGVVNYLASMARRPGIAPRDVILALTTLSFDIAVTELLLPLVVGARLELVDRETAADADRLGAVIDAAGVTLMQATPSTWTLLLEGGWRGRPSLVTLAGGEALPPVLADRLLERVDSLWNVYGPTETTVWSTLHPMARGDKRVFIGRPLANTTVDVLERGGEPAPWGVPGELCIGGEGLARGYSGRPDLTAERFIPDPFGGVRPPDGAAGAALDRGARGAGRRLYRTGDLARRLSGGELELLGRVDNQVKVRGFRIELGEVEAALAGLAGVAQAAVVVRQRGAGERLLEAFVVPVPAAAPPPGELRAGLKERLPEYMVPAVFTLLPSLPVTPSGKVDRRALSRLAPGAPAGAPAEPAAEPRNAAEALLAAIWAAVLGRDRVGIHDNFFELGGDSILAIRVVARARQGGLRFTPRHLFQHQTIAALAASVASAASEASGASGESAAPRLTALQHRLLAGDPAAVRRRNDAVLLGIATGLPAARVETALAHLCARHAALRLRLRGDQGRWTLTPGEPVARPAMARIDLSGLRDAAILPGLAEEARDRLDLGVCPWSATLFHRGAGEPDLLLLAVHRAALDGPSWAPLLDDWGDLGLAGDAGAGGALRPPGEDCPVCELDEAESQLLAAAAAHHGASCEELVAAALVEAVAAWSGAPRVALAVEVRPPAAAVAAPAPVACRSRLLALTVEPGNDPVQLLKRIKEEMRRGGEDAAAAAAVEPAVALRWWDGPAGGSAAWAQPLRSRAVYGGRTLEVLARMAAGRLRLEWCHAEAAHRSEATHALAAAAGVVLRSWLGSPPAAAAVLFTPVDFPAAGLTQDSLDDLLVELAMD